MNAIKTMLLKLITPSGWVDALKGKKRLLGVVALILWVVIYLVPQVAPQYAWLANVGIQAQQVLYSLGINLDSTLLDGGAAITVIGLIDWLFKHVISDAVSKALKAIRI